ncbi:hypothetical protein ACFQI7_36110 [Paenibacillus allorhizosphaerae]|uniref:Uncharacterized protein n=1 Tax=Paenibacillus allorhizosphaerae TaxID=2849866 RepID=A0ABN7TWP3_9BACL|nr:hypothetical protein [Paenibacillus allorhizosphaerae]CAG7658683.1 hypothetical protein PAECIP111802_07126 [Paenibacillus allorhizosphaerae]
MFRLLPPSWKTDRLCMEMPILLCIFVVFGLTFTGCSSLMRKEVTIVPLTEYTPKPNLELIQNIRKNKDPRNELFEVYRDLTVIDIHNHDAGNPNAIEKWGKYGIDRIVLFGDISEPSAQITDQLSWQQYRREPSHVYPSFAGFPIYEDEGLTIVRDKLEQGYLNIGEIAAASTNSPLFQK